MEILGALQGLIDYSIPTIFVIVGVVLFIYPFVDIFTKKDIPDEQKKSAKKYGVFFIIAGIILALLIKPPKSPQGQEIIQVYNLPIQITNTPIIDTQNNSGANESEIVVTQQKEPTKPSLTDTPQPTSKPSTATPQPVTNVISVLSNEEGGARVNVSSSGIYEISYIDDAYSPWPNEQGSDYQGWTTILRIYINRSVEWGKTEYGLVGPINHDAYLGPGGYYLDKNDAIASSTGDRRTFRLNAGDYITLVTLDEQGRYFDNRGKLDIGITYLGTE